MKNNYICIIPARSGSKRLKNKNIIKINKKKLFDYTLEAALKCKKISNIVISTNIKNLTNIKNKKIIFLKRPSFLCKDICSTESAMNHAIKSLKIFKSKNVVIVLLQPTSPLRDFKDITNAIKIFEKKKYDSLLSVYLEKLYVWGRYGKNLRSKTYNYRKRGRTQDKKPSLMENGAIYLSKLEGFLKYNNRLFGKIGYSVMTKRNSLEIDYAEDIKQFKAFLK
tara:strand:+ start:9523 stop:10191 length:669 start_codon:yes stop_codon:yes gene_type:complete